MSVRIPVRMKSAGRGMQPREADIQRAILDWLAAERIWHIRLNTGAMAGSHKGKKWFVRFGRPGMADILAITGGHGFCTIFSQSNYSMPSGMCADQKPVTINTREIVTGVYWIEVKAAKGVQSDEQKRFEKEVKERGMTYILARDLSDVTKLLGR